MRFHALTCSLQMSRMRFHHRNLKTISPFVKNKWWKSAQGMSTPLYIINWIFPPKFSMAQYSMYVLFRGTFSPLLDFWFLEFCGIWQHWNLITQLYCTKHIWKCHQGYKLLMKCGNMVNKTENIYHTNVKVGKYRGIYIGTYTPCSMYIYYVYNSIEQCIYFYFDN
jgi:hypothetical protein